MADFTCRLNFARIKIKTRIKVVANGYSVYSLDVGRDDTDLAD